MTKKRIALTVVALAAVAGALALLVPTGRSSGSWPFSVSSDALAKGGIVLTPAATADPGNGDSAEAAAAQLVGVPAAAVSYMHCKDIYANSPAIDQDCYVVQYDASRFTLPSQAGSSQAQQGSNRLSWYVALIDPATGKVIETAGRG
jgi:hypothetical protein